MECILKRSPNDRSAHENATFRPCYPWQCARCGWNPQEVRRRKQQDLVTGKDGLRHVVVSKPTFRGDTDDTGD